MSEYWKSVPRKFCEFCKCWITDNKPSVEFHERGKKHQEHVQLRLKEVRKKSLQNSLAEDEMKKEIEKMEKAALEAFKKDVKENPELAAKYGVALEARPHTNYCQEAEPGDKHLALSGKEEKDKSKDVKEWFEAKTPEGYPYYWSTSTGESQWEAPDQYVTLEDQGKSPGKSTDGEDSNREATENIQVKIKLQDSKTTHMKETRTEASHSVYGAWNIVKEIERPSIYDETSEPPALEDIPLPVEHDKVKPQKPRLKEKTVTSLGPPFSGPVAFKKRKIASSARNSRQRNDDN